MYEGDADGAWQVASDHGCDRRLWMSMACARERTHPQDAIGLYEQQITAAIGTKKAPGYRQAVDLLDRTQRLHEALGRPERFREAIARLRTEHERKRSLMTLFSQQGW